MTDNRQHNRITRSQIKLVAFTSMLIDHFIRCFVFDTQTGKLVHLSIGRAAYPLFLWLFFFGFFYSRSHKKQLLLLTASALLSEWQFDYMLYGNHTENYMRHQNIMFTWILGLIMLCILEQISRRIRNEYAAVITEAVIICLFAFIGSSARVDYGHVTFLILGSMYMIRQILFREDMSTTVQIFLGSLCALSVAVFTSRPGVLLALPFVLLYSGSKGKYSMKYLYYAGYPLHLLIFAAIKCI